MKNCLTYLILLTLFCGCNRSQGSNRPAEKDHAANEKPAYTIKIKLLKKDDALAKKMGSRLIVRRYSELDFPADSHAKIKERIESLDWSLNTHEYHVEIQKTNSDISVTLKNYQPHHGSFEIRGKDSNSSSAVLLNPDDNKRLPPPSMISTMAIDFLEGYETRSETD